MKLAAVIAFSVLFTGGTLAASSENSKTNPSQHLSVVGCWDTHRHNTRYFTCFLDNGKMIAGWVDTEDGLEGGGAYKILGKRIYLDRDDNSDGWRALFATVGMNCKLDMRSAGTLTFSECSHGSKAFTLGKIDPNKEEWVQYKLQGNKPVDPKSSKNNKPFY